MATNLEERIYKLRSLKKIVEIVLFYFDPKTTAEVKRDQFYPIAEQILLVAIDILEEEGEEKKKEIICDKCKQSLLFNPTEYAI